MTTYKELLKFVWQFMRQQKGIFLCVYLLDLFLWPVDAMIWPYILGTVIDIFTHYEGDRLAAWEALKTPMIVAVGLVIYMEIGSRTMGFLLARAIPKLQANLRMAMFDHVQQHSPHYFNERFSGSLANKITDMTNQVETILQQLFWPILPALATCIMACFVLGFVNMTFTWILIGWILIHFTICVRFSRSVDMYEQRHGEARSVLLGKIVDSFTNNFAVNLFYRFSFERKNLTLFQKVEEKTNVQSRTYIEKMRMVLSSFFFIGILFGVFGSLIYFWLHDRITTGEVAQVFNTTFNITWVLWAVGSALPVFFQAFGNAKQAYSIMRDPQDLGDRANAKVLKIASGEIRFDTVSFHYGEKKLFRNKQAHIRGGERVGLVGYTGAGKSTFINLILRFYPLESGTIYIDGQDISTVALQSLRSQIALIPQDPVLFHRTLRENICYGRPDATEEQMKQAAKLAHCDEFIRSIPKGYDAKVGERGTKLSGGEKQRIVIARAILADAPILILDEATSSLDSVTEKYIQDSLDTLMDGRTTLVIAHRLSTLSRMDRILVFDNGKIVEEGTPAALLQQGGHYAQMWKMQIGGFLPDTPH